MANSRTLAATILVTLSLGGIGCKGDQLKGAEAEVQQGKIKVTVPAIPSFEVPKQHPDGSHTIKGLRVLGKKYLKSEISIRGLIIWKYDCRTAVRLTNETDEALDKRIETDPTICQRPHFYLGDTADTPVERAIKIVEIPRAPTAAEKKNLPKDVIKAWPAVPPYDVGDEVVVAGPWVVSAPHGDSDTNGLLVYKTIKNVTKNWETPPPDPNALPPATVAPPAH